MTGTVTDKLTATRLLGDLGFVLAVDNCARGCEHCPAYGSRTPVSRAPFDDLEHRLIGITAARRRLGLAPPSRVVHCWRISDPLDYAWRTATGRVATCADVAGLWRDHLGQGLYLVTNGSEGKPTARRALARLVARPELVSQVKLTITHADRAWGTTRYLANIADDLRTLIPLWELPATRWEDPVGRRFRVNVKSTPERYGETRAAVVQALFHAGLSVRRAVDACGDPQRVRFKQIYDLGTAAGQHSPLVGALDLSDESGARHKPTPGTRDRLQYGVRPDGRLFIVDMYAFTEHDLSSDGRPVTLHDVLNAEADCHAVTDA
ncbi:MAG: hypothetical protein ACRDT4_05725 [Micromonosporaceae bacterium]